MSFKMTLQISSSPSKSPFHCAKEASVDLVSNDSPESASSGMNGHADIQASSIVLSSTRESVGFAEDDGEEDKAPATEEILQSVPPVDSSGFSQPASDSGVQQKEEREHDLQGGEAEHASRQASEEESGKQELDSFQSLLNSDDEEIVAGAVRGNDEAACLRGVGYEDLKVPVGTEEETTYLEITDEGLENVNHVLRSVDANTSKKRSVAYGDNCGPPVAQDPNSLISPREISPSPSLKQPQVEGAHTVPVSLAAGSSGHGVDSAVVAEPSLGSTDCSSLLASDSDTMGPVLSSRRLSQEKEDDFTPTSVDSTTGVTDVRKTSDSVQAKEHSQASPFTSCVPVQEGESMILLKASHASSIVDECSSNRSAHAQSSLWSTCHAKRRSSRVAVSAAADALPSQSLDWWKLCWPPPSRKRHHPGVHGGPTHRERPGDSFRPCPSATVSFAETASDAGTTVFRRANQGEGWGTDVCCSYDVSDCDRARERFTREENGNEERTGRTPSFYPTPKVHDERGDLVFPCVSGCFVPFRQPVSKSPREVTDGVTLASCRRHSSPPFCEYSSGGGHFPLSTTSDTNTGEDDELPPARYSLSPPSRWRQHLQEQLSQEIPPPEWLRDPRSKPRGGAPSFLSPSSAARGRVCYPPSRLSSSEKIWGVEEDLSDSPESLVTPEIHHHPGHQKRRRGRPVTKRRGEDQSDPSRLSPLSTPIFVSSSFPVSLMSSEPEHRLYGVSVDEQGNTGVNQHHLLSRKRNSGDAGSSPANLSTGVCVPLSNGGGTRSHLQKCSPRGYAGSSSLPLSCAEFQSVSLSSGPKNSLLSSSSFSLSIKDSHAVQPCCMPAKAGNRLDPGPGSLGAMGRSASLESGGRVRNPQRHPLFHTDGESGPRLGVTDLLSPRIVDCYCSKDLTCPSCVDKKKKPSFTSRSAAAFAANAEELLVVEGMPSATWTPTALANWNPADMSLKDLQRFLGSLLGGDSRVGDLTSAGFHVAWMSYQFLKQLEKKNLSSSEKISVQLQSHKKSSTQKSTGGGGGGMTQQSSVFQQTSKPSKPISSSSKQPGGSGGLGERKNNGGGLPGAGGDIKGGGLVISTLKEVSENSRRHGRIPQQSTPGFDGKKSKVGTGLASLHRHHTTNQSLDFHGQSRATEGGGQGSMSTGGNKTSSAPSMLSTATAGGRQNLATAYPSSGVRRLTNAGGSLALSDERNKQDEVKTHDLHKCRGRSSGPSSPPGEQADGNKTAAPKTADRDRRVTRAYVGRVPWQTVYGFEDVEWPRFVCGTIDRRWVLQQCNIGVPISAKISCSSPSRGKASASSSSHLACPSSSSQENPRVAPLASGGVRASSSSVPQSSPGGGSREVSIDKRSNTTAPLPSEAGQYSMIREPKEDEPVSHSSDDMAPVNKKLRSSAVASSPLPSSGSLSVSSRSSRSVTPSTQDDTVTLGERKKAGVKPTGDKQETRPAGRRLTSSVSSTNCSERKKNVGTGDRSTITSKSSETKPQSGAGSVGGRYEIAVQFEEFPVSAADCMWPDAPPLPETLTPGLQVQVAVELRGRFAFWWVDATIQSTGGDGTFRCVLHTDLSRTGWQEVGVKAGCLLGDKKGNSFSVSHSELLMENQDGRGETLTLSTPLKEKETPPLGQSQKVPMVKSEPTSDKITNSYKPEGSCSESLKMENEGTENHGDVAKASPVSDPGESARVNIHGVGTQRTVDNGSSRRGERSSGVIKRGRVERGIDQNAPKKRRGDSAENDAPSMGSRSDAAQNKTVTQENSKGCIQVAASQGEEESSIRTEGRLSPGCAASVSESDSLNRLPNAITVAKEDTHLGYPEKPELTFLQQTEQRRSIPDEDLEAEDHVFREPKSIAAVEREFPGQSGVHVSDSNRSSSKACVENTETQSSHMTTGNRQDEESKPSSRSSSTGPHNRSAMNKRPLGGGGGARGRPSKGRPMMFDRFKTPQTYHVSDFSPPQVPLACPLTRRWRLRPRRLDVSKDLHPGAVICLSGAAASLFLSIPHSQASPPPFMMRDAVIHRVFFARDKPPVGRGLGGEAAEVVAGDGQGERIGGEEKNTTTEAAEEQQEMNLAGKTRDTERGGGGTSHERSTEDSRGSCHEALGGRVNNNDERAVSTGTAHDAAKREKEGITEPSVRTPEKGKKTEVGENDDGEAGAEVGGASETTEGDKGEKATAEKGERVAQSKGKIPPSRACIKEGLLTPPSSEKGLSSKSLTSPHFSVRTGSPSRVRKRGYMSCSVGDIRSRHQTHATANSSGRGKSTPQRLGKRSSSWFSSGVGGTPVKRRESKGIKASRRHMTSACSSSTCTTQRGPSEGRASNDTSIRKEPEGNDKKTKETTTRVEHVGSSTGGGAQQQSCFDGVCPGEPVMYVHLYFPYGNQQRIVSVEQLTRHPCYRLPYDLHAHFPPGSGQSVLRQAEDFLWAVPRAIPVDIASQASSCTRAQGTDKAGAEGLPCMKTEPSALPSTVSTLSTRGRKESDLQSADRSNVPTPSLSSTIQRWDEKTGIPADQWKDFPPFCLVYASLEDSPFRLPRHLELAKLLQPELDFDALAEGVWRLRFAQWRRPNIIFPGAELDMPLVKSEYQSQPDQLRKPLPGRHNVCPAFPCRLHHPSDGPPASWMPTVSLASWSRDHCWVPYPTDMRSGWPRRALPPCAEEDEQRVSRLAAVANEKPDTQEAVRKGALEDKERSVAAVPLSTENSAPVVKQQTELGKQVTSSLENKCDTSTRQHGDAGPTWQFSRGKRFSMKTDVPDKKPGGAWPRSQASAAASGLQHTESRSPVDCSLRNSQDLNEIFASGICPWAKLTCLDGGELDASTGWTSSALSLYEKLLLLRWNQQQAVAEKERLCRVRFSSPYRTVADDILQPLTHCAGWGRFSIPADLDPGQDQTDVDLVQQPAGEGDAAVKGQVGKLPLNIQGLHESSAKKIDRSRQHNHGGIRCPAGESTPGEKERKHGRPGRPAKLQQDITAVGTAQKAVDRVTRRSSPTTCFPESDQPLSFLRRAKAAVASKVASSTSDPEQGDAVGVHSGVQDHKWIKYGTSPMAFLVAQEPPHPIYWDTEIDEPGSRVQSSGTRTPESGENSSGDPKTESTLHDPKRADFSDNERGGNGKEGDLKRCGEVKPSHMAGDVLSIVNESGIEADRGNNGVREQLTPS